MRVVVDLSSVRETARLLSGVAHEYDRVATRLQGGHGLNGVTGPHRGHMAGVVASVARQLRSVASTHRTLATDLQRRVSVAERPGTSPLHRGLSLSAATFTAGRPGIPIDRDGDGIAEAMAYDRDGDGFYETFVVDTNADGTYDLIFVMDRSNNLQAAAYDGDGDGFAESFIADTPGGVVRLRDTNRDGYHDHVAWDSPAPQSRSRMVVNPQATPGYSLVVAAGARPASQALTVTYSPSATTRPTLQYSSAGSQGMQGVMVNPNARPRQFMIAGQGADPVYFNAYAPGDPFAKMSMADMYREVLSNSTVDPRPQGVVLAEFQDPDNPDRALENWRRELDRRFEERQILLSYDRDRDRVPDIHDNHPDDFWRW